MRVNYDQDADVLHILLIDARSDASREVAPGVFVETDAEGRVIGVEITTASQRGNTTRPIVEAAQRSGNPFHSA